MSNIINAINSLCLTAQNRLIDHHLIRRVCHLCKQTVELTGTQHLSFGKGSSDCRGQLEQAVCLFWIRRIMHTENACLARANQTIGRRDIGSDHEILDQPLRFALAALADGYGFTILIHHDPAFFQIECQRFAFMPRQIKGPPGTEQVVQNAMPNPDISLIKASPKDRLHLIIGQSGMRADQRAVDAEICSLAILVDVDFGHHGGAVLIRA